MKKAVIFRQSAVVNLTSETVQEEHGCMPKDIHAVFLGSGRMGLGLDATGMMGLDMRVNRQPETWSHMHSIFPVQNSLAVYRDSVLSTHASAADPPMMMPMPCGWLSYRLMVNGQVWDTEDLAARARDWKRSFSPLTGEAVTSFAVDGMRIEWRSNVAPDAVAVDFGFGVRCGERRSVGVEVRLHLHLRDGTPLACGGQRTHAGEEVIRFWDAADDTSTAPLHEPVRLVWALACQDRAEGRDGGSVLTCRWDGEGTEMRTGFRMLAGSDRDGTHTAEFVRGSLAEFRRRGVGGTLLMAAEAWQGFHRGRAEIRIGNPEKEFLFRMCQYGLKAGGSWRNGYALGTYWSVNFGGLTFWDAFFICDGMLRAGHEDLVRSLCAWLLRTRQPTGRPHFWMLRHDGSTPDRGDNAFQVCLAFAGIFIRLAECGGRAGDRAAALEYLRQTAAYLLEEVLEEGDGAWRLRGAVAGDVGVEAENGSQEHGLFNWTVVTLAKYVEYAGQAGERSALISTAAAVVEGCRAQPVSLARPGMWSGWYPYLTGINPFADRESFRDFMRRYHGESQGALSPADEPQGDWSHFYARPSRSAYRLQPWDSFSFATSLSMTGLTELALEYQDDGLKFVSGPGYLGEAPAEVGAGQTFYPTTCGAYLSSVCSMLVEADLWRNLTRIAEGLPQRWRHLNLSWRGVRSLAGPEVDGEWTPSEVRLQVRCARPCTVSIRIPPRIEGEPLRVTVDGGAVPFREEATSVVINLDEGSHAISIGPDLERPHGILLLEPHDEGRSLRLLLEETGGSVRWLRRVDDLPRLLPASRTLFHHVSYVQMPPELVSPIRRAVESGMSFVTLFHAGLSQLDRNLGELTGVRGHVARYWDYRGSVRRWRLTAAGRAVLPGLPEEFEVLASGRIEPNLLPDVEVLATEAEGGRAVVTRRHCGAGWVWWSAVGNKNMDVGRFNIHRNVGELMVWGRRIQDLTPLPWMNHKGCRALLQAMVRACA